MAQAPRQQHALRTTLKILGMTQVQLAKRLDIATVTIEKFLNGDSRISEELAMRISAETGLDFEQLVLNSDPENPRRPDGRPIGFAGRAETRAQKIARLNRIARFRRAFVSAALQAWMEAALQPRMETKEGKGEQISFHFRLHMRLVELVQQYGLEQRTAELMGVESIVMPDIMSWRPKAKSARKPKRQPL